MAGTNILPQTFPPPNPSSAKFVHQQRSRFHRRKTASANEISWWLRLRAGKDWPSHAQPSIQVKALLLGGSEKFLSEDFLGRVLGQLEVMHAGVDRRVRAVALALLPDDSQPRVQVGQPARRQRRASRGELEKSLRMDAAIGQYAINVTHSGAVALLLVCSPPHEEARVFDNQSDR